MTREEAISLIKSAQLMLINPTTNEPVSDLHMALDMAIFALEQEPCDDAISREAANKKEINDVLEQIRAEIEQIATYGQIDDNTSFIRDGGMVKKLVFEIIDRYMKGE